MLKAIRENDDCRECMTKIAFFGASVTQQRNGFVDYFAKMSSSKVLKFGFGGMHLNDAGICFIDKVVESKPKICFVDWFSTYYIGQDGKLDLYIDAIVEKLLKIGCRVVFLFCVRNKDSKVLDWKLFYSTAKNYLKNKGIEYIPLDEILSIYPVEEILRDEIHSTERGSQIYAETIFNYLRDQIPLPKAVVKPNIYSLISVLPIKASFDDEIVLEGNCFIQGFHLQIGPWSGIVKVELGTASYKENTWDQWCYYGRDHFSFNLPLNGKAVFIVSNEKFDTSLCKESIDFSKHKKKLVIHEIYYRGDSLKICSLGSKRGYFNILLMSKIFAMKHRLATIFGKKNHN